MARLRMAVIGVGHLGKEHARILAGMPEVDLVGVADVHLEQAEAIARRCGTRAYGNSWPLLNLVDAATIVVPTLYHHAIACEFLRRGIHLLVEKPLASDQHQAEDLVNLAHEYGAILQVGHIERFNPAFEALQQKPLQPKFIQCERLGPFSGRSTDIGVVLDLMIHDLDLLLALVQAPVQSVEALGASLLGGHEDMVSARLTFANGCVAQVTASRVHPRPSRQMHVWGPEGYAGIDFARRHLTLAQPSRELREHGIDPRRLDAAGLSRFKEQLFGQHLQMQERDCNQGDQLTRELEDFVQSVQAGTRPRVSGEDGLAAVALATWILEGVRNHSWEGRTDGPVGPLELPQPRGLLFEPSRDQAAA